MPKSAKKSSKAKNCHGTKIVEGLIPGTKNKFFQCCPSKGKVPKCHIFDPVKAALARAAANKRKKMAWGAKYAANINRGRV